MQMSIAPKLLMSKVVVDDGLDMGEYPITCKTNKETSVIVSDNVLGSDETEKTSSSKTYVKLKEIAVSGGYKAVNVRVKYNLKCTLGEYYVYGIVKKNGEEISGVTENSTNETTYQEYQKDIEAQSGDTIELWVRAQYSIHPVGNGIFSVCGTEVESVGMTGQEWS